MVRRTNKTIVLLLLIYGGKFNVSRKLWRISMYKRSYIWSLFLMFSQHQHCWLLCFFKLDVRIHQNDINVFYFSEFLAFFTWIQPTRVEELKRPWKNCVVLVAVNDDGRFSGLNFGRRPEFCMAFEMSLIKLWQQA